MPNHYETLGVSENADDNEIRKAYRSLSLKYHPDRNSDPDAGDKFREINEANEILSDSQKRQQYDHSRNFQNVNPLEHIINELFRNQQPMFSHAMRGGHHSHGHQAHQNINNIFEFMHQVNGQNNMGQEIPIIFTNNIPMQHNFNVEEIKTPEPLEMNINISYENAYFGQQLPIQIERNIIQSGNTVRKEIEKLYITIPKGIDHDEIMIIQDKGNCANQIYGDLKIQIKLLKHSTFERNGLNLIYTHTINFKESICGFETIIQSLDGNSLKLKSSPGNVIQNRDEKIIKGKGFSRSPEMFGDLIVSFKVLPPKTLSEKQVELFSNEL